MKNKRLAKLGGVLFIVIGLTSLASGNFNDIGGFIGGVVVFLGLGAWMLWVGFKKDTLQG